MNPAFRIRAASRPGGCDGVRGGVKNHKNYLQLFREWLQLSRLLDNLSFQGMDNLQVNVVQ